MFRVDKRSDPSKSWGEWCWSWVERPSPQLEIEEKRKEINRRMMRLKVEIRLLERKRRGDRAALHRMAKKGEGDRMMDLQSRMISKWETMQEQCAYSIIKYQEGLITLMNIEQMLHTTSDFGKITSMLGTMNRTLNLKTTAKMTKAYDKGMDHMETKEEMMSEMFVERDSQDVAAQGKAKKYLEEARDAAGLKRESDMYEAEGTRRRGRGKEPVLSEEDRKLLARVEGLSG